MATESGLQAVYTNLAQSRLESAGILFQKNPNCSEDNGIEGKIVRCNIAMFIWSAAIDIGSSLMIQEARRTPVGHSGDISAYIARDADRNYPELGLRLRWRDLLRLHNIQHRADHEVARFTDSLKAAMKFSPPLTSCSCQATGLPPPPTNGSLW